MAAILQDGRGGWMNCRVGLYKDYTSSLYGSFNFSRKITSCSWTDELYCYVIKLCQWQVIHISSYVVDGGDFRNFIDRGPYFAVLVTAMFIS